jgi:hypothetical protein
MQSLDPLDASQHQFTADIIEHANIEHIEHGGWNCSVSDALSTTEFSYDNGHLVDVHHSGIEQVGHELNYASTVDSIAQGYDTHSHNFGGVDLNPSLDIYHHSQLEIPSLEPHLSTSHFYADSIGNVSDNSFTAAPRSGAEPDYAAAANNEGWAKHYEDSAKSWASDGSLSMAASRQADADYYHAKAAENLKS